MKILKRSFAILISFFILLSSFTVCLNVYAAESAATVGAPSVACKSAILMEASTGKVLYERNADEALPPASVTKVMTLLLIMEAIEAGKLRYEDMITASAYACSMGGSQIYLKEGEQMSAEDMIKSVVISSANDAAVALAEHVAGSEGAFVDMMNQRAQSLGMTNTSFENTNGLDDTVENHVTSARDIAIMSRELIKYERITEFSSIWMDTIRNGSFGLTNTNRLVRYYKGATGLKTGSTSKAGFCVSATAKRDGMTLICVVMGAETGEIRNSSATSMLDWGFSNFGLYVSEAQSFDAVKVVGGKIYSYTPTVSETKFVVEKSQLKNIVQSVELPKSISAPVESGAKIGCIKYVSGKNEIAQIDIFVNERIEKIGFRDLFYMILSVISGN